AGQGRQRQNQGRTGGQEALDQEELGGTAGGASPQGQAGRHGDEGAGQSGRGRHPRQVGRGLPGQDARQAPSPPRGGAGDLRPPGPRPRRRGRDAARRSPVGPLGVAAAVVVVDQLTKVWAVSGLSDGPVRLIGSLLQLRLTRNPGGAFSLLTNLTPVLAVLAVVMVAYIVRTTRR